MEQSVLWDDTFEDALGSAVKTLGGYKKVAGRLWPALDEVSGAARLRASLNPDHAQKLSPGEMLMIAKWAREAGDHSFMNFLARELGYERPQPLAPEQARKRAKAAKRRALLEELLRLDDE